MKMNRPHRNRRQGSTLLYVVFIVLLLSVFASAVGSQALFALDLSERLFEQLRAGSAVRGAVQAAALVLSRDLTPATDGLHEAWADHAGMFQDYPLAGSRFTVMAKDPDGEAPRYGLSDEERRINVNTAPGDVLQRLIEQLGGLRERQAIELADAIQDWRDEDHNQRPFGAEGFYYRSLRDGYDCKDGPFENIEELLLVRGMSPELYRRLEPFLTVYGSGAVNVNTAGPTVLRALGLGGTGVAGVTAYRSGEDGQEGTGDDRVLGSLVGFETEWDPYVPAEELTRLKQYAQDKLLATRSTAFRLNIEARTGHPAGTARVACIMDRAGTIQAWSER